MRRLLATLVLAAGFLAGIPAAQAAPFDDGLAAYNRRDFDGALKLWQPLADAGDVEAQYYLGIMYALGYGVAQDAATAAKWYRKAADTGLPKAQFRLARLYDLGQGVDEDSAQAMGWYRKAADQGYARAQFSLGLLYYRGQGVPRDYVQAHKWYSLAAAGFAKRDAERDPSGRNRESLERDAAMKNRELVAAKMSTAEIAEAEKQAREWKRR